MSEITPTTFKKPKPHALIASLPAHLKDPANYMKIQKAILDAGATRHSHAEVVDWAGCKVCQGKQRDRVEMMRRLGFTSGTQYMVWQKTHAEIKRRYPLVDWKA